MWQCDNVIIGNVIIGNVINVLVPHGPLAHWHISTLTYWHISTLAYYFIFQKYHAIRPYQTT